MGKGPISLMWQMLVEPTPPSLLSHFTDDRTEAQVNKVGRISKKIMGKWAGKLSGLGRPRAASLGDLAPRGVSPASVQVAGDENEGTSVTPPPAAPRSLCFSAQCPVEWGRGPET